MSIRRTISINLVIHNAVKNVKNLPVSPIVKEKRKIGKMRRINHARNNPIRQVIHFSTLRKSESQ